MKKQVTGVDFLPITKMEELEIVNNSIKEIEEQEAKQEQNTAVKQQKLLIVVESNDENVCVASTEYFGKAYSSTSGEVEDCVSNLFFQIKKDLAKEEIEKTIAFLKTNQKNAENMAINIHHLFVGDGWFSLSALEDKLSVSEEDAIFKILFLKNYGFINEEAGVEIKDTRYKINYNDQLRKIHLENEITTMEANIKIYKSQLEQIVI